MTWGRIGIALRDSFVVCTFVIGTVGWYFGYQCLVHGGSLSYVPGYEFAAVKHK